MAFLVERRQNWSRIIGLERRGAPLQTLYGQPLPDPTKLEDEDFQPVQPPRMSGRTWPNSRPLRIAGGVWMTRESPRDHSRIRVRLRRQAPRAK